MYLKEYHEDGGWLLSIFTLTNRALWEMMLRAVYTVLEYFANITIFVDNQSIKFEPRADVLPIPEAQGIGIAGEPVMIKEPMIIIFYSQMHFINLHIRCGNDDLRDLDYEGSNEIACPTVDAIEPAMYQGPVPAPVEDNVTREAEDTKEEKQAKAPATEPPIPPPLAIKPQDSMTPTDVLVSGARPPIPLPPVEVSTPPTPSPAPAPRRKSGFRCN